MADNNEEDYNEKPEFIDMNSVVEVQVPADDAEPMDDDDDDPQQQQEMQQEDDDANNNDNNIVDMSKVTMTSHTDAVYAVCAHYDTESKLLSVVSGGGDDRAYLHLIYPSNNNNRNTDSTTTIPLSHPHTDSISAVSINNAHVNKDVSGKPQKKLVAVGSYDGSIVLYDALDGTLVKVLEGPSDVEWCCFHPKGGTVSFFFCIIHMELLYMCGDCGFGANQVD